MIVVKVELWPKGERLHKRHLGTAKIANDGTGTNEIGNYNIEITFAGHRGIWYKGTLRGFPRKALNAWDLLLVSLISTIGKRLEPYFKNTDNEQ